MKLNIKTAADLAAEALTAAKQAARAQMIADLTVAADAVTGPIPQAERDSWSTKAIAARAVQAGSATADQHAVLQAECAITGETEADLAASIIAKADAYAGFAASMAALRRNTTAAIDASIDQGEVADAMTALNTALAALSGGA